MTSRVLAILVLGLMSGLVVGCRGFRPATDATRALVKPMELAAKVPSEQFVVELESPFITGVYDALCVVDQQTLRVQLFPDVGGKVLDVTIGPLQITAEMPGSSYRANAPFAAAEPHLALGLAAMLGELRTAIRGRVLGERVGSHGAIEVQLVPALGSGTVVAELAEDGRVQCYRIGLGVLQFTLNADGSFEGRGFAGRLCP